MIGTTLLHYRIEKKLGEGGMGVVYLARDAKLGRSVALKFLPDKLAADPDRRARFEREARLLAALNHSNIAGIFGLEAADGSHFLVLEYVPGLTIAERIREAPIPVEDSLRIALQVAEASAVAHENGIIHRDLKPENIKVTHEGKVSVLDFGLAKALAEREEDESDFAVSVHTTEGLILGTTAYMSPEQARGKPLDRRTDIWSFGCVLYEMLTGRRAFRGKTISDTLAAILEADPDWSLLPDAMPRGVRVLLVRCLAKNPRRRLQDFGEARIGIEDALAELETASSSTAAARRTVESEEMESAFVRRSSHLSSRVASISIATAVVAVLALIVVLLMRPDRDAPRDTAVQRFVIELPNGQWFDGLGQFDIDSEGEMLAYIADVGGPPTGVYVRALDSWESTRLATARLLAEPRFSPDRRWVAYMSESALYKVEVDGGSPPVRICDLPEALGLDWAPDGSLLVGPVSKTGILRIPVGEGEPQPLTTVDEQAGEFGHWRPVMLPDRDTILYTIWRTDYDDAQVAAYSLASGESRVLLEGACSARYSSSGHLLFGARGGVFAIAFDLSSGKTRGERVCVLPEVSRHPHSASAAFHVTSDGTLFYQPSSEKAGFLVWIDREGNESLATEERRDYGDPEVSPDGLRLALSVATSDEFDVWTFDLKRDSWTRITHDGMNGDPHWSPDGQWLAMRSVRHGVQTIERVPADGSAPPEPFLEADYDLVPHDWARGWFVYSEVDPTRKNDLYVQPLVDEGERPARRPFATTEAVELNGVISPDGRFIAYASDESGDTEVYVREFPDGTARWPISSGGGFDAAWNRRSGRNELIYRTGRRIYAVPFEQEERFRPGPAGLLFEGPYIDVRPDSNEDRFIAVKYDVDTFRRLWVVRNWTVELEARVPSGSAR